MAIDAAMLASGIILAILFFFLLAVNAVILLSCFAKTKKAFFQPLISIVVPAYNEEKRIKQCLQAIFDSSYPKEKYEVLVVDDGSTDNTLSVVKQFKKANLVLARHLGKVEALNTGIKLAKHEFVITVDADTLVDKNCFKNIVLPFVDNSVGAVSGLTKVKNKNSFLGMFQNIEYFYNGLVREGFSKLFGRSVWFHGAIACYRKKALQKAGYLAKDTLAEDLDISLEMHELGYKTLNASKAGALTLTPETFNSFIKQRTRWSTGVLQCLKKHNSVFNAKTPLPLLFIFLNQWWWSFFALISFPLFLMQILYWLPYNSSSFFELALYFFKWFSLAGPLYVVYKSPVWGVSFYSFFGVASGILTSSFLIFSVKLFKDKLFLQNACAIFFYFPYTIILNISTVLSILKYKLYKPTFFIR